MLAEDVIEHAQAVKALYADERGTWHRWHAASRRDQGTGSVEEGVHRRKVIRVRITTQVPPHVHNSSTGRNVHRKWPAPQCLAPRAFMGARYSGFASPHKSRHICTTAARAAMCKGSGGRSSARHSAHGCGSRYPLPIRRARCNKQNGWTGSACSHTGVSK